MYSSTRRAGWHTLTRLFAGLLVCVLLSGCYKTTAIRTSQLAHVNSELARQTGANHEGDISIEVERPNGNKYQIEGEFDLRLVMHDDKAVVFEFPVTAVVDGNTLVVTGKNKETKRLSIADIKRSEIVERNGMVWALGAGVGGVAVVMILVTALL